MGRSRWEGIHSGLLRASICFITCACTSLRSGDLIAPHVAKNGSLSPACLCSVFAAAAWGGASWAVSRRSEAA
jgi:hypothetical protein